MNGKNSLVCKGPLLRFLLLTAAFIAPYAKAADPAACAAKPAIKAIVDQATRAVNCINRVMQAEGDSWSMNTTYSITALSASIGVRVAELSEQKSPDTFCRTGFADTAASIRPMYNQAITNAKRMSGGTVDIHTLNRVVERCNISSQLLGTIASEM